MLPEESRKTNQFCEKIKTKNNAIKLKKKKKPDM